jgi:hypothetical protein
VIVGTVFGVFLLALIGLVSSLVNRRKKTGKSILDELDAASARRTAVLSRNMRIKKFEGHVLNGIKETALGGHTSTTKYWPSDVAPEDAAVLVSRLRSMGYVVTTNTSTLRVDWSGESNERQRS